MPPSRALAGVGTLAGAGPGVAGPTALLPGAQQGFQGTSIHALTWFFAALDTTIALCREGAGWTGPYAPSKMS